jgi:hypothetical protein
MGIDFSRRPVSLFFSLLSAAALSGSAIASQVATVTVINGAVQIFSNPAKNPANVPSPRVKFKGTFYTYRAAQIGDRVGKGNIPENVSGGEGQSGLRQRRPVFSRSRNCLQDYLGLEGNEP